MERQTERDDQEIACCPSTEIAAYLDDELSAEAESALERHIAKCSTCSDEINVQKQFINVLNGSLGSGLETPRDFTKKVVVNAESSVRGLRRSNERLNALFVCCCLLLFVLFSLGASAPGAFATFFEFVSRIAAVISFSTHLLYDLSMGIVIVLRSVGAQPGFDFAAAFLTTILIFGFAFRFTKARLDREKNERIDSGNII
jgi:hypothetical protein